MTVNPREALPTVRGRQKQAAIDAAARTVLVRKGFLAATGSDIANEVCIATPANVFHRTIQHKETGPT